MAFKGGTEKRGFGHIRAKRTSKIVRRKAEKARVLPLSEVKKLVADARKKGLKVVTTNGCFDILHIGHVHYLEEARSWGDMLFVGINTDASVQRNKGPKRPIVRENERAEIIASLKPVDAVFLFDETTPDSWLEVLRPDVHVKGADRSLEQIVERETVEKNGGKIVLVGVVEGRSTTNIINKILEG